MCGFAGEFAFPGGRADPDRVRRMADRLRHRGPDSHGHYLSPDGRCAIAFHRLAVIDPAGSDQPMSAADGAATVACNGEIYNFLRLREQLARQGAVFQTAGDVEVLLHLYLRHGEDFLHQLDGMFAFALHDARQGQLTLARDRLGQKPLWYAPLPGRIVFGSEAKALLAHPEVDRRIDTEALLYYLTLGYIPAPRSAWVGIRKLCPAEVLSVGDQPAAPRRYWTPTPVDVPVDPAEQAELVRQTLARSVQDHMVSDVPLGALLSGGLDSAVVVALMCKAAGRTGGVRTFTAGFPDAGYDERPRARQIAEHCGSDHQELAVRPRAETMVGEIVSLYDEPFADSSALPTLLICRQARAHVTVALTGDGGDEVFGGYDRYVAMHMSQSMRPWRYFAVRLSAFALGPFAPPRERHPLRRLARFARALPHPFAQQYLMYRFLFLPEDLPDLLGPEAAGQLNADGPGGWFCELYEAPESDSEVQRAQLHDLQTYLPDDLLVKTDMASMACSLELRAPMLDHRLVEMGIGLPDEAKVRGRRGKRILREAFGGMLPREILAGRKRGFGVPLGRWLREDIRGVMQDRLLDSSFLGSGFLRPAAVHGLVNDHLSGRDDHSHRLWSLLVLAEWLSRNGGWRGWA